MKQRYELRQGRSYGGGGIWDNARNCWIIWGGIDGNFHGQIDEFNEFLRLAAERIEFYNEVEYLKHNPQFGEPLRSGYYVVYKNEEMKNPLGMVRRRQGPRGGKGNLRWVEPEKHAHVKWDHDNWHWTLFSFD